MTAMSSALRRLTRSLVRRPSRAVPRMAVAVAIAIAGQTSCVRRPPSGGLEQLPGVAVGGLVAVVPAQHPDDLGHQRIAIDPLDRRPRLPSRDLLLDPEVSLGERGDLRQ